MIIKQDGESEICIVSGEQQIKVDGNSADIRYDQDGSLAVNDRATVKKDAAPESQKTAVQQPYSRLHVPYGKRVRLTLSDGSVLHVNSGTVVTYPAVFGDGRREIYVKGEIYAEVRRDRNNPFTVRTGRMDVQALGTSFGVSVYPEDSLERVVLVSGAVDVSVQGNKLHLKPNQAYTCTEQGGTVETVDTELYTSWRNGIYIFRDESIEHILLRLARYYNVTLVFSGRPSGAVCSGKLELKDDISNLLNGLSEIASFNYAVKDGEYRIQFIPL
jgi:ferric-dicitrate binding protein FerR (iron transport regulator)